ncbi:MAG TPA: 2-hydroxyacyl-CoA dehydratase family protein [Sphingomonadaceae bacterium]|nr:2-hydroxyacyl-CoA dehydratase family protein [Sphingomonadaceae bacterium]
MTISTQPVRKTRQSRITSSADAYLYHREWFQRVRERVSAGEPFAIVSAETPMEIFQAMDIPYVPVQWWSSIVSAKRKAPAYLNALRERGFPDDQEQYFSLGLASSYDRDPESAPWGGMPMPTMIVGDPREDNQGKIYELWAREYGAHYYPFERAIFNDAPDQWWELGRHRWDEMIDPAVLDLHVEESRGLIRFIEQVTGRRFCETRFKRVLDLVNEQEEYFTKARDLVARTVPSPITVTDTFTSVMMPQWHRGTEWARDKARAFYEEVEARVRNGEAACPAEKVRLAWFGTGLWFNVDFYDSFIASHDAVFVWSMYLGIAADGYARYGEDPLRTLSARYAAFVQYLTMEPWPSAWYVKEAELHQIDGVVILGGAGPFTEAAFHKAGVPTLRIRGHNVDSRQWREEEIRAQVCRFIEEEARLHAERRRSR